MAEKPFWDKQAPKNAQKRHMSHEQVRKAKANARAAGRPWPNLVDSVTAMRIGKKEK